MLWACNGWATQNSGRASSKLDKGKRRAKRIELNLSAASVGHVSLSQQFYPHLPSTRLTRLHAKQISSFLLTPVNDHPWKLSFAGHSAHSGQSLVNCLAQFAITHLAGPVFPFTRNWSIVCWTWPISWPTCPAFGLGSFWTCLANDSDNKFFKEPEFRARWLASPIYIFLLLWSSNSKTSRLKS